MDLGFSEEDKTVLRNVAINAIKSKCLGTPFPSHLVTNVSPKLREKFGVFVTIKKDSRLRGCMGLIVGHTGLIDVIRTMATQAAFNDVRFTPIIRGELNYLDIEISILSPLTRIKDHNEIEIGRHGIVVQSGGRVGLLLPQVAVDGKYDAFKFLQHTCRKAGLADSAWIHPNTSTYIFEADVF